MNNRAMPHVRHLLQASLGFREHVHHTVFLNVHAFFKDNSSPIATQNSSWTNVTVWTYNHIARHIRLRVYESGWVNHRNEVKELVNCHIKRVLKWWHSPGQRQYTYSLKHISFLFLAVQSLPNEEYDRPSRLKDALKQSRRRLD